jgi:hypothetical protein
MDVLAYTGAIVLLAAGVTVTGAILLLLLRAVVPAFRGRAFSLKLRRGKASLERADAALQNNNYKGAVAELVKAPVFDALSSRSLIQAAKDHNQNVLSRCVITAEALQTHLQDLGEVERLLLENAELQLLRLKAKESYRRLEARRADSKKKLPEWTKSDFKKREQEISQAFEDNRKALTISFSRLFASLDALRDEGITYH